MTFDPRKEDVLGTGERSFGTLKGSSEAVEVRCPSSVYQSFPYLNFLLLGRDGCNRPRGGFPCPFEVFVLDLVGPSQTRRPSTAEYVKCGPGRGGGVNLGGPG